MKNHQMPVQQIRNSLQEAGVDVSMTSVHRKLNEQKYRRYTPKCNPLVSPRNMMARLQFAKNYLKESAEFWNKVLCTDETKINLYQSDGKSKAWRRKGTAQDPKHTTLFMKNDGGDVMACTCLAATGISALIFIDDVTADGSSKMISEYIETLSAKVQANTSKLIGRCFILQQDNDPKHAAKATNFFKAKNWKILEWPNQSPNLNPIEHAFHMLKRKVKETSSRTNKS
ncbi:transposable element Tc1 transposase [Narcine bancroftii]|uniref:transposable element Tc1 transposase n=1 Tax=Narcine bancroftii TaxID=1343680 RepID=UPI00383217EF